ncbi:MAG TPA: cytochrome P450 [Acidimicrobiales bacterium]
MTTTGEDRFIFDPLAGGFVDDPYQQYAALRETDPVQHSDLLAGWVVTRHDDVGRLLRDPTISSSIHNATPTPLTENELARLGRQPRAARTVVLQDDPDHARTRHLMAEPFRARQVGGLRESITQRVHAAFDRLHHQHGSGPTSLDLVAEFAYPLPVEIFSEMLGVPDEDHPKFRYWTQCVARTVDPVMTDEERTECLAGLDEMYCYLEEQAAGKRENPTGDLMSHLVTAEVDGEGLSHDDLMAQLVTLYLAGHEPTAALISAGMLALLREPDQLAKLRAEPHLLGNAIHELLRFDGPNQFVRRITTEPIVLSGVELAGGAVVYASPASANRDARRWGDDADRVVIDRPDASRHLQFGAGAHACLGSHLARLQIEIAFAAILDRLDQVELAGDPVWNTRMFIRGLASLPIACTIRR